MRFTELCKRTARELWRDPLWLGLTIAMPVGLLLVFLAIPADWFTATNLVPGMAIYAFSVLSLSAGLILARDRESALLSRLLAAPLRSFDFIAAYSVPFLGIAVIQTVVLFAVGAAFGIEISGNFGLVLLVLALMAVCLVSLGLVLGTLLTSNQVGVSFAPLSVLVAFGGVWFDLIAMGGVIQDSMDFLPFSHSLYAIRDVMLHGASLSDIATDLYWTIGYTVAIVPLGIYLFKRQMVK